MGTHLLAAVVDINGPGRYLHWSVFAIAVSNLGVVIVMLLIFGAALFLRFPPGRAQEQPAEVAQPRPGADLDTRGADSWTGRVRLAAVRWLPPQRLLPETQPSYVASWVYVFGVVSLAALVVAIVSGFLIALGGVDWWHTNPVGHFFNSLHLWSVEFFMAFMVIHLWGKFFMAAWRGKRARTWITGMLAFVASIVEAFTGYLSQQNFDSQWIATNGKDAVNSTGLGGWFNLMNFGQMLLWHVVLMPLVLLAFVGIHILLVRYRGVVHPFAPRRGRDLLGRKISGSPARLSRQEVKAAEASEWRGPLRRYDIIREAALATIVVAVATVALAGILSSPDVRPITIQKWATADPADFVGTAASELAGTSETATYGPPYNNASGSVQRLVISWQSAAGVWERVDPARSFVIAPLQTVSGRDPSLEGALARWTAASPQQQTSWASAYLSAAAKVRFNSAGAPVVAPGRYGPVPVILAAELTLARQGALDASLIARSRFYGTDFTKPLLFLEDGSYFGDQAQSQHLQANQWGVMNETGSYPGQPWLWLYQLWYHIPGFDSSKNVDLIAIYLTGLATLLLLFVPFLPGLRDIPRAVPIHRLVWRRYYRDAEQGAEQRSTP